MLDWLIMYFLSYVVKWVGKHFSKLKFLRKSSLLYGDCVGISYLLKFNLLTSIFRFLLLVFFVNRMWSINCYASTFVGLLSPKEAEAYALLEAMRWVLTMKLTRVIFELYAKCTVDAFHSNQLDLSEFSLIIQDC